MRVYVIATNERAPYFHDYDTRNPQPFIKCYIHRGIAEKQLKALKKIETPKMKKYKIIMMGID